MKVSRKLSAIFVLTISILLFGLSLAFPAILLANGRVIYGLEVLVIGWCGVLWPHMGIGVTGWYANVGLPAIWISLLAPNNRTFAILGTGSATLGLGLALGSFLLKRVLIDEANHYSNVVGMGAGFYMWLASFVVCFAAHYVFMLTDLGKSKLEKDEPAAGLEAGS